LNQVNEPFKALILAKGNNKSEIARKLGVSPTLIGQYINGRQKPKTEFFVKWEEVYGEDIKQMFLTNVPRETVNHSTNGSKQAHEVLSDSKPTQDKYIGLQDKHIKLLEETVKEKKDQLKELQARLDELTGRQADFLAKVEGLIERYEHLVLAQLQAKGPEVPGSSPTVLQQTYKSQGSLRKKST
jgi:transcriptional regulator with XRE-family HTH domain